MKKLKLLAAWLVAVLVFASCSEDSGEELDPMIFSGIEVSKEMTFTEDTIELTIDASGYSDVEITSNKSSQIKFERIANGRYEISADESVYGKVYVALKDAEGNYSDDVKTVNVGFYKHGVQDGKVIEGIKIDVDKAEKITKLLGEPLLVSATDGSPYEFWSYPSKGISFGVVKSTDIVFYINLYSSNYYVPTENGNVWYIDYPYDLPYGWRINSSTMNSIIDELGQPNSKSSTEGSTLRSYRYDSLNSWVRFYSDTEDGYFGKVIKSWSMY